MIIDTSLVFSNQQAVTTSAPSTNAIDLGATGTPYSVILVGGQPSAVMNGAYAYDAVKQLVDTALGN